MLCPLLSAHPFRHSSLALLPRRGVSQRRDEVVKDCEHMRDRSHCQRRQSLRRRRALVAALIGNSRQAPQRASKEPWTPSLLRRSCTSRELAQHAGITKVARDRGHLPEDGSNYINYTANQARAVGVARS